MIDFLDTLFQIKKFINIILQCNIFAQKKFKHLCIMVYN